MSEERGRRFSVPVPQVSLKFILDKLIPQLPTKSSDGIFPTENMICLQTLIKIKHGTNKQAKHARRRLKWC